MICNDNNKYMIISVVVQQTYTKGYIIYLIKIHDLYNYLYSLLINIIRINYVTMNGIRTSIHQNVIGIQMIFFILVQIQLKNNFIMRGVIPPGIQSVYKLYKRILPTNEIIRYLSISLTLSFHFLQTPLSTILSYSPSSI